ncbi:MAG: signal peptidase II [Bacilli bacterium]|nr:signal peptidase II [Bacilli bacterium]
MNSRENIYKITSIILMLDQFIKIIINRYISLGSSVPVIPNFFSIMNLKNTGAAFSILEDSTVLLVIISVIVIVLLDRSIKKISKFEVLEEISLGLIMGGIFGNLIDRIIHHGVIDYLSFKIFGYSFPVFNLADMAIVIGVGLYLIEIIKDKQRIRSKYNEQRRI